MNVDKGVVGEGGEGGVWGAGRVFWKVGFEVVMFVVGGKVPYFICLTKDNLCALLFHCVPEHLPFIAIP